MCVPTNRHSVLAQPWGNARPGVWRYQLSEWGVCMHSSIGCTAPITEVCPLQLQAGEALSIVYPDGIIARSLAHKGYCMQADVPAINVHCRT